MSDFLDIFKTFGGDKQSADLLTSFIDKDKLKGNLEGFAKKVNPKFEPMSQGGVDKLNLGEMGIDFAGTVLDDDNPYTYSTQEVVGDVANVGAGVGRFFSGDVVGGVKQTLKGVKDIFSAKKQRDEMRDKFVEETEESYADAVSKQQQSFDPTTNLSHGGKIEYEEGGAHSHGRPHRQTPHHLRYEHAMKKDGGKLYEYKDGGKLEELPFAGGAKSMRYLKGGLIKEYQNGGELGVGDAARLGLDVTGMINPLAGYVSGGLDARDAFKYAKEGDWGDAAKAAGMAGLSFIPFLGPVAKNIVKGTKVVDALASFGAVSKGIAKTGKFVAKGGLKTDKWSGHMENVADMNFSPPNLEGDYGFDVGIAKYGTGGMTQGEFSHKTNPLTVVDEQGNDTGMELTGGEGVFDKDAMSKLDQYKKNKNYKKAGKLIFSEMDSWEDAGTAKYGTRIKEY